MEYVSSLDIVKNQPIKVDKSGIKKSIPIKNHKNCFINSQTRWRTRKYWWVKKIRISMDNWPKKVK